MIWGVLGWGWVAACVQEEDPCALQARPASIDEVLDTLERLPSPVSLECFLVSLQRPLGLELTSDVFSAQPADGPDSPRVFVRNEGLTMSVVPTGEARRLLEFGEHHPSGLTVKAELEFPVALPLAPDAPFERVHTYEDGTSCGVCHGGETEVQDGRYASAPLRPRDSRLVPLDELLRVRASCDEGGDDERCAMLSALLDHGEVVHDPFPEDYPTLFGE
jgi:hypothetical protein